MEETNTVDTSSAPDPDPAPAPAPQTDAGRGRLTFAPDVKAPAPISPAASPKNAHYRYRQSEMIPASAQREGTLQKCNRHGRWQKRYFRCEGNYLKYFKKESSTSMLGVIDLRQVTTVEAQSAAGAEHAFTLKGAGSTVILSLSASSASSRDEWTRFLSSMLKQRNAGLRKQSIAASTAAANEMVDEQEQSNSLTYTYPTQKGNDTVVDATNAAGANTPTPSDAAAAAMDVDGNLPHAPFPNPFEKVVVLLVRDAKVGLGLFMDSEGAAPTFGCWVEHCAPNSPAANCEPPIMKGDSVLDINGQSTSMLDLALVGG